MIDVQINFPAKSKSFEFLRIVRTSLKWLFFIGALVCPLINILVGGKAWSVVVLWGMYIVYKTFISPDVVEKTLLGIIFTATIYSLVMLVLIGLFIAPGWLMFVLPVVAFSCLILSALVFFADNKRQKKQAMPFFWEALLSLTGFLIVWKKGYELNWPMIVLGGLSSLLLIIYIAAFGKEFIIELSKRFHIKG